MKLLVAALAVFGVFTVSETSMAQGGQRGGGFGVRQHESVAILTQALGLSQAQQAKLRAIFDTTEGRTGGMQAPPQVRMRMMDNRESEINALLTPAQKNKLASLGGLRGLIGPVGRIRHDLEQLGLSAEQKHKTNLILNDLIAKIDAARGAGFGRDKFGAIWEDHKNQLLAVLSASQKAKFEANMPQRGPGGRGPGGGR